jgi:hypothetical protein
MTKTFRVALSLIIYIALVFLVIDFYFSEENIISTNKSRSTLSYESKIDLQNLPLLKNDTANVIVYTDEVENFKKEKKAYKFWELIK